MGKYDKGRFQKEMAIRYCIAQDAVPFPEVIVKSSSDLSDSVEVLTDLDVLGIKAISDGGLRRIIFDCKTTNKMSSINRAFWAVGVKEYTGCDEAYVLLKARAVHNHRISALSIGVDLHDEQSFIDLGRTLDIAFPSDACYQSSIERWNRLFECYNRNIWAFPLFDFARNVAPITHTPWSTFRHILAELRTIRGHFDPSKEDHLAIFLDVLCSAFVLWSTLGRDIRRFYEPAMDKAAFEKVLRYYLWGGKTSYEIRQQMRDRSSVENGSPTVELPSWESMVSFAGLVVSSPQSILSCCYVCREIGIRAVTDGDEQFNNALKRKLADNNRIRQFTISLSDYLVSAGGLPRDMAKRVHAILFEL
jgi:hypothetical protein